MPWNEGIENFTAAENLAAHRRVKISTSSTNDSPAKIDYSDATQEWIGITEYSGSTNDLVSVRMRNFSGVVEAEVTVSSAIQSGTDLYGADDGKFSDATNGNTTAIAKAMQKAAASNEHIKLLLINI